MATLLKRDDPVGVTVEHMLPASGYTGTARGVQTVLIPIAASGTGTAQRWVNPEAGTVAVKVAYYYTTAGTGTVDIGVSAAATASNDTIVNGGTMAAGVRSAGTVAATAVTGNTAEYFLVGSGSGIIITHDEAATGTAVGGMIVQYFLIA